VGSHHIARCFAERGWRVGFISAPVSPLHLLGLGTDVPERMATWRSGGAIDAASGIWHYVPFAPVPWGAFPGVRGRKAVDAASWLTRPLLAAALRRAGFDRPQVAYADHFLQDGLLRAVSPERVLFRRADNLAGFPGAGADFAVREAEFARRADLTICTTESSASHMAKEGVNRPMVVPNGIQLDRFFDQAPVPVEYLGDDRPIIVFVGASEHRVDIDLMVRGATELRQFRWVVIGPFDGAARERLRAAGAHLLGSRAHASLASYLQHARVGIVPFSMTRHGALIREVSPLKVLEYAASGLPVVGMKGCQYPTDLPTPLSICGTVDAFLQAVKDFAEGPKPERPRMSQFASHTWSARLGPLFAWLEQRGLAARPRTTSILA
jgi:glycosyltransferase involved in cell wall biosynthesis